jgi:transposase
MNTTSETLPNDLNQLKQLLLDERRLTQELKSQNQYLLEQFRLAQYKQFGKSSEVNPAQGELFNEAEALADEAIEPKKEKSRDTRNAPKRKPLPKDLPREVIVHDLSDDEKNCDCCGQQLHKMSEKKSEQLEFIPAQVKVIEHVNTVVVNVKSKRHKQQ